MSAFFVEDILPGLEETLSTAPPPEEGDWTEVAPGQYLAGGDPDEIPLFTLAKIMPGEDGEFTLEPDEESPLGYFRLKTSMKIAGALKMNGLSYKTLRRLCLAGFVDYLNLAPHTMFVSIDSLKAHIEVTKNSRLDDDEGFWTEEKLIKWRETCGL